MQIVSAYDELLLFCCSISNACLDVILLSRLLSWCMEFSRWFINKRIFDVCFEEKLMVDLCSSEKTVLNI